MRMGQIALLGVAAGTLGVLPGAGIAAAGSPAATTGSARTFTVNSVADRGDARVNGTCSTARAGECTLRAAIQEADAAAGPVTIAFGIAGSGVHTINLGNQLPAITN